MISIVIPVRCEDAHLSRTLDAIKRNIAPFEIILAVAVPTEQTLEIAERRGVRVVTCPLARRSTQMNVGAQHARGEILVFLHADTSPPKTALDSIRKALQRPGVVGGAFARRYEPTSKFLTVTCFLAEFRSRLSGWFLGDQAIFVKREVFQRLGGFCDRELFEDLDFSRRMQRQGRVVTLRPPVTSSARRFANEGACRKTLSDLWLTFRYICGEPDALVCETMDCPSTRRPQVDSPLGALSPPAFPRAHCKDGLCPSVGLRGPAGDFHSSSEKSSLPD